MLGLMLTGLQDFQDETDRTSAS